MPLTRLDREPLSIFDHSIEFWMLDGTEEVRCLVASTFLDEIAEGVPGSDQDRIDCFYEHRDRIETIAGNKFDAGLIEDGFVRVTTDDLASGAFG